MCTCMREKRKILTRGKYRWMVMNQNQILVFNIMGANGRREKRRSKIRQNNRAGKKDERTRFKIVSVWECEKPELKKKRFCKKL